jgi:hypothetical protein
MLYFFLSLTSIYLYSLYRIGNTLYRMDHEGNYNICLGAIKESFIAPFRVYILLSYEYGIFWFINPSLIKSYITCFLDFSNPLLTFGVPLMIIYINI